MRSGLGLIVNMIGRPMLSVFAVSQAMMAEAAVERTHDTLCRMVDCVLFLLSEKPAIDCNKLHSQGGKRNARQTA